MEPPRTHHEVGIDLIELPRIVHVLGRFPTRFEERVLTDAERAYCRGKVHHIAGRWAAKEAVSKVLGLGVRGVGWREIEILPDWAGKPHVILHARAAERARTLGLTGVAVSITHERSMASAVALGEREGAGPP